MILSLDLNPDLTMLNQFLISSVFLTSFLSFLLGIYSFFRNPKSLTVKLLLLFTFTLGLVNLSFWFFLISNSSNAVTFYARLVYFFLSFVPVTFLHFLFSFTIQLNRSKKILILLMYFFTVIFSYLSLTNSVVKGASPKAGIPLYPDNGTYYYLFIGWFILFTAMVFYFLFKEYFRSSGIMRQKLFWILIGVLFVCLTSLTGNLPQTFGVFPYGYLFAWMYPIFIMYGVFVDEIKIKIKF